MSSPATSQPRRSNPAHLAGVIIRWAGEVMRFTETTVAPLLDVFIRLWLAGIFWASGMVKLHSWTTALYLSAHEYPVSWLDPVTAAWLGEAIEIICPPLLVFGLATRFAVVPMLICPWLFNFPTRLWINTCSGRSCSDGSPSKVPGRFRSTR